MVLATEDWFVVSHFKPLIDVVRGFASHVCVATNETVHFSAIRALGAEPIGFDFDRASVSPFGQIRRALALAALLDREKPDAIHAIGLKPITTAALALRKSGHRPSVIHLTGLGNFALRRNVTSKVARGAALALVRDLASRPKSLVFVENDRDRVYATRLKSNSDGGHVIIVPGAGVDLGDFPDMPPCLNAVPVVSFVGRLIESKGIGVLVDAYRLLRLQGTNAELHLYGDPDLGNAGAVTRRTFGDWRNMPGLEFCGRTNDIPSVWRGSDICVVPSLGGEGMPKAMLEAAACARPLIVTNVPGPRHFVRHGVEGLIVPPGDAPALADALKMLIQSPALRAKFGAAARARLASGYTTAHVADAYRVGYRHLCEVLKMGPK